MRLTEEQRDLRWQIEVVCYRCLHAIEYLKSVSRRGDDDFWKFTENCYAEVACLLWCHVFNSRNKDPVHYWKLFGEGRLSGLGVPFVYATVQQRLWSAAKLDKGSYEQFRKGVVDFRNCYVSHREYTCESVAFPCLDKVKAMCLEMRNLLEETVQAETAANPDDPDLKELLEYYAHHQNEADFRKCREETRLHGPGTA